MTHLLILKRLQAEKAKRDALQQESQELMDLVGEHLNKFKGPTADFLQSLIEWWNEKQFLTEKQKDGIVRTLVNEGLIGEPK